MNTKNGTQPCLIQLLGFMFISLGFTLSSEAYYGAPGTQVQVKKSMTQGASIYGYLEYLPRGYSELPGSPKAPVVIFLHGLGELGDGENNYHFNNGLSTGLPKIIANGKHLPAIVLSPQSAGWWDASMINQFVDYVFRTYKNADANRLYVTGLSMGGGGTWDYLSAFPNRVAAVVPICGASQSDRSNAYPKPVWAFHAWNDSIVSRFQSIYNIDTLTPSGGSSMDTYPGINGGPAASTKTYLYRKSNQSSSWVEGDWITDNDQDLSVRFTMYNSGDHSIWNATYYNDAMWNWLFTHSLVAAPTPVPTPVMTPTPTPTPVPTLAPPPPPPVTTAPFTSGKIAIDFGASGNGTRLQNQLSSSSAGSSLSQLKTTEGKTTLVQLNLIQGFGGMNLNGTQSPHAALDLDGPSASDSFYGNHLQFNGGVSPQATLSISGLDPNTTYNLSFFASRMSAGGDNRETQYDVSGSHSGTVYLQVAENTQQAATLAGMKPNSSGAIQVVIKRGPRNTNAYGFYYLGALQITASTVAPQPQPTATPTPTPTPSPTPVATPVPATQHTLLVDFGGSWVQLPSNWNDARLMNRGESIALRNSQSSATGIRLGLVTAFAGVNQNGTSAASAQLNMPTGATQDSFYGNAAPFNGMIVPKAVYELTGLNPALSYRLEFFASRMAYDGVNRQSLYRAIGETTVAVTLDATDNVSNIAATSVRPNAQGVIRIEIEKGSANTSASGFFYLGNLKVQYSSP